MFPATRDEIAIVIDCHESLKNLKNESLKKLYAI